MLYSATVLFKRIASRSERCTNCLLCSRSLLVLCFLCHFLFLFFFSSRRRHTRYIGDWSSDVRSSDLTRKQWLGAAIVGTLLLAGGNGGVAFAEQWVATGLAAVGIAAVPLWTALFAGLWGRWPTRIEWFGLGLGFVGVILLNLGNGVWANPLGAIALLLAPICWALGSAWSQHISLPSGLMSSSAEMLIGGGVLVIMSFGLRERTPNLAVSQSLWALAYLVVFGSLVAFSAYGYLLRYTRPALATSYAYVNPMVAVGLGVVLANERLTPLEVVAILITLTGVGLASLGNNRRGRWGKMMHTQPKQENRTTNQ